MVNMNGIFVTVLIVGCLLATENVSSAILIKRQVGFTGSFSSISIDDSDAKFHADFASKAIAAKTNSQEKLVKLIKAETQEVNGINYKLNFEIAGPNAESRICEALVFTQPSTNTRKLIRSSCTKSTTAKEISKRQVLGVDTKDQTIKNDFAPTDVNHYTVQQMAKFATTTLSQKSTSGPITLVEILNAETKIYNADYKLTLKLKDSTSADPFTCEVIIIDEPWKASVPTTKLEKATCTGREALSFNE